MSLPKKMRGLYISCQPGSFLCVEQNYGLVSKQFRKLLLVIELACVEEHLPRPRLRSVGPRQRTGFALIGRSNVKI